MKKYTCTCKTCGANFDVLYKRRNAAQYCSRKCAGIAKTTKVTKICKTCKKEFKIHLNVEKKGQGNYCSRKCHLEWHNEIKPELRRTSNDYSNPDYPNSKSIVLKDGVEVIVDLEDYDYLSKFNWYLSYEKNGTCRIIRSICNNEIKKTIHISREIMNFPEGKYVDHINHNTLDNRKCNLRICTKAENAKNCKLYKSNKSGYKGVYKFGKKWRVMIRTNGKQKHLGLFDDILEAAKAYDDAARELHKDFAYLNFKNES